jgi:hypothetical protein
LLQPVWLFTAAAMMPEGGEVGQIGYMPSSLPSLCSSSSASLLSSLTLAEPFYSRGVSLQFQHVFLQLSDAPRVVFFASLHAPELSPHSSLDLLLPRPPLLRGAVIALQSRLEQLVLFASHSFHLKENQRRKCLSSDVMGALRGQLLVFLEAQLRLQLAKCV